MDTLTKTQPALALNIPRREQGFVLILALVILIIMTLSAVAMIAGIRGGVSAAGNIAFRQAATRAGDVAVESGFQWVRTQLVASATALDNSVAAAASGGTPAQRYYATFVGLDSFETGCTKDTTATEFTPQNYRFSDTTTGSDGFPCATKLSSAPSGYSLYYVIHRMARETGTCPGAHCAAPSVAAASGAMPGCSYDPSSPAYCGVSSSVNNLVYYRITVKVVGPKQNNRYIQAFVY